MNSFFNNFFGKKQEPSKPQNSAEPARRRPPARQEGELYKKGDLIGGNYEVLGTLGKGGFGVVFLVHDRSGNVLCALKTIRDDLLADRNASEAFKKEALLWINLERHPHVLAAQWVDEVFGRLFVAMQYMEPDTQGCVNLAGHLANANGPIETNQLLTWAIQFCSGMEHANAHGIKCHRDIKPANILIARDGTLKIGDFGLASAAEVAWRGSGDHCRSLAAGGETDGFSLVQADGKLRCGTPGYMAPEVYRCESVDTRSDIYSFGLVLWQMAKGNPKPPFMVRWSGSMDIFLREIYEQQMTTSLPLPEGSLGLVIRRCVRSNPAERYPTFQELREDLETIWIRGTGKKFAFQQMRQEPATSWLNRGVSLSALGRHEEAIGCFDESLAIEPGNPTTWSNKGAALDCLCRYNEAICCYDKALSIDPRNASIWINKGFPLGKLDRHAEAIACYDKALAINPQKANAWSGKGMGLRRLGRPKEAIDCYSKALTIEPRHAGAWNNKGSALSDLNMYQEAIDCYCKALAIDPRYVDSLRNKGDALAALGRPKEAIGCYDMTLAIDPQSLAAWYNKGNLLYSLGKYTEALDCYSKTLELDPQDADNWGNKGAALYALGRHDEAIDCLSKALAINPKKPNIWTNCGNAYDALKEYDRAIECYKGAIAANPRFADAWYYKAMTHDAICIDVGCRRIAAENSQNAPLPDTFEWHKRESATSYRSFLKAAQPERIEQIAHARKRLVELES